MLIAKRLYVQWILDTHPHADHFFATQYLKSKTGAPTAIGDRIGEVQALWKKIYNWPDFPADGSQWDHLFRAGECFKIGELVVGRVMFSPGHTLSSITYIVDTLRSFTTHCSCQTAAPRARISLEAAPVNCGSLSKKS